MNINHIHLAVRDIENSKRFYEENFGFHHKVDHGPVVFMTNGEGFDLALAPNHPVEKFPEWFHFGCRLESASVVEAKFKQIHSAHPEAINHPLESYDDFIFFRVQDPDGYILEIYWE